MSSGVVRPKAANRLLYPADIHSVDADRYAVVGGLLDQQGLGAGTHSARRDHRADNDHPVDDVS